MVQKQAANMRSQGDGFADDDPLAELARIVGFDQPLKREPVVTLPQAPDMGSADFNLEDELMREFEGYEAAPALSSYAPPLSVPEPVVSRPAAVEAYQPPQYREEPRFEPEPVAYVAPEPAYEPEPVEYAAPEVSYEDAYVADAALPAVDHDLQVRSEEVSFAPVAEPEVNFDLADELEFAVADADVRPEAPVAPVRAVQPEPPRLRLPLANFSAQPVRRAEPEIAVEPPRAAPAFDLSDFDAPAASSVSIAQSPVALDFGKATFDWAAGPVEPIPASQPTAEVAAPAVASAPVVDDAAFSVEAEPRFAPAVAAPVQASSPSEREEPDFNFDFLNELAIDEEVDVAPKAAEPVVQRAAPAVVADEEFDPFQDQEFDLQLDDIELDLSELDVAPQKPQPQTIAPAVAAAPVFAAAAAFATPVRAETAAPSISAYAGSSAPAFAPTPSVPASAFSAAVTRPASDAYVSAQAPAQSSAPMRPVPPVEDSFSFDPSEISEQDDLLETLSGMDVPEVPVADVRPAQPVQPDYDIDIDAELATLFEEPVAPPQATPIATSRVAAPMAAPVAAAPRAQAAPLDDFDAFEKALEEDFRSSMTSQNALEPESRGHITIAGEGQGFRFRRLKPYLMAGTAAVLLLAGAGGLYAWLGTGAVGTLTSGEPQVIAADKSPVKIVPEDPGGKSVPNQDKAVYDRVAGNGVEDPKQPSLISSEEEPVDVVQRTLIPENLPMEGENDQLATPVGETEDPRLLPDGQPQQAAAEDPATITPRKVRTMIVRPDGTLVAQEVPAEPAAAPVETAAAQPAQTDAGTPVLAPPSVPTATGDTVRTVDTRVVTPGGPAEATTAAAAPAATATAATEVAAATPATTEAQSVAEAIASPAAADPTAPRAPIPTTRPADQPVNVVGTVTDQGNLRPAQPAATAPAEQAQAPAEVAAASPAAAAPATAAPAGSYGIQIASLPSEADAQKSYRNLSSKFGNVLGGKPWEIRQADIPGKGTFYRVRVVAGSKDAAVALCEQYRSAGGSCLVSR
ncbi:MAG: SPOR domain-containing protein [Allorhizobium sp.]